MSGLEVANDLTSRLIRNGLIVHQYKAYSTNSIYLKLDYGLACGIRIADHPGRKKYNYRFNVIKDYKGNKVIKKDGLICYFYSFDELDGLLDAIQKEKQEKIEKYGLQNYQIYMNKQAKTDLYKRFKKVKGEI